VERIGAHGIVVAAMSTYYASAGRGGIVLRLLDANHAALSPAVDKVALAAANVSADAPSPNQSVQLFETTPKVANKKKKKKLRAVIETPEVMAQFKKPEPARVSLDSNAEIEPTTKTPEGVAVSPEQRLELSDAPKQKTKTNGAMMKYLKPSDTASKESKASTTAVPRRLHQEPGVAKVQQAKGDNIKASAAKKARAKTPLKSKSQNVSGKANLKLKDPSSSLSGKSVEKVKVKRIRSPCVPRKGQHKLSVLAQSTSSQPTKNEALRKFLCQTHFSP